MSLPQLSQITGEIDHGRIAERLTDLEANNRILLLKYLGTSQLSRAQFKNDSAFFHTGSLLIRIAPQGRKYFEDLEQRADDVQQTPADQDHKFARLAIEEARKSVPEDERIHPKVGVVVVKDGRVLATAHRGESPQCHAEYVALEKKLADLPLAGSTVYTTLEPCTSRHHPKVPCAIRLAERKVARVVIGMLDPDDRISGRGQRALRKAGIATELFDHDLMTEIEELNRDFIREREYQTDVTLERELFAGKLTAEDEKRLEAEESLAREHLKDHHATHQELATPASAFFAPGSPCAKP